MIIMMMVQHKCGLWQEQRERVESERQYGKTSKLHLAPGTFERSTEKARESMGDKRREREIVRTRGRWESGRGRDQAEHSSATVRNGSEKLVILLIV